MKILLAIAISLLLLLNPGMNAYAAESQTASSEDLAPSSIRFIKMDDPYYVAEELRNPDEIIFEGANPSAVNLMVENAQHQIVGCDVTLRSYNGELVGPTIRVHPGSTIHLNLINNLSPEDTTTEVVDREDGNGCEYAEPSEGSATNNTPHNFNTTNFHTHGLHVDPDGCSDNVLRVMRPKVNGDDSPPEYEIIVHIPEDHTSGTFWYHAHLHGSTALQVSSAMAGALIVEPETSDPSNIQTLDDILEIANAEEKIFVLQQIAYDEEGKIEGEEGNEYVNFGPGAWKGLRRHITINGQIMPVITMHPGEVQRWRFIHGGVREGIELQVRDRVARTSLPLHEIAVDGIPLGKLDSWEDAPIELEPGYRSDVLFQAPALSGAEQSHEYFLVDKPSRPLLSLLGDGEVGSTLAKVIVTGEPMEMELPTNDQLAAAKTADAPRDIDDGLIAGTPQEVIFSVHQIDPTCAQNCPVEFTVNDEPFNSQQARTLHLGDVERWNLSVDSNSVAPSHPFHIHVNPFQYVRQGPDGNETIWRDTLLVRQRSPKEIITRYDEFDGRFVLHCHILDHEDQGMMQVVEITN